MSRTANELCSTVNTVTMSSSTQPKMSSSCLVNERTASLLNIYMESVIREAKIEAMGIKIRGKLVSNLRYADDIGLCAESQEEAEIRMH